MSDSSLEHLQSLSDEEVIRILAFERFNYSESAQKHLKSEMQRREIQEREVAKTREEELQCSQADGICVACGNELTLSSRDLLNGYFLCPACNRMQWVNYDAIPCNNSGKTIRQSSRSRLSSYSTDAGSAIQELKQPSAACGWFTSGVMVVTAILLLWELALLYSMEGAFSTIMTGGVVSDSTFASYEREANLVYILETLVGIVGIIAFVVWVHGTNKGLRLLGKTGLKHSPGWAAGGFFVPFYNLAHGFRVVKELWMASDPGHATGSSWQSAKSTSLIGWWWGLLIVFRISSYIIQQSPMESASQLTTFYSSAKILDLIGIVDAILAIVLIARMEKRRRELIRGHDLKENAEIV